MVNEAKIVDYLENFIIPRGNTRKNSVPLSKWSIQNGAKSLVDLYKKQKLEGNIYPHPREGGILRGMLSDFSRQDVKRRLEQFEDRGANTLNDGYDTEALMRIAQYFLIQNSAADIRNRTDLLVAYGILARSQSNLMIQLADMSSYVLKK
jgi:hypothetical protein